MENIIREVQGDERQLRITIPKNKGIKKGDYVKIEKVN